MVDGKELNQESNAGGFSRRDFIKTVGAMSVASVLSGAPSVFAAGSDKIRVGVIGVGGRGTGAAKDCMASSKNVEIVAMGDLFPDHMKTAFDDLKKTLTPEQFKATPESCFTGFDAYKKVLASDVDLVILATPPAFRPQHLQAAIEAGKHVFMEKPVAVDPVGIRQVIAASELAKQKGLGIVAGTQRRHQPHYLEIMKRIHDGAIGEVVSGQCYWTMGGLWVINRTPEMSDMEWQIRNWLYFTWLSGDHIVEQHVHNLDVMNWAMGRVPEKIMGMGGRQVRTGPEFGNIFDHFALDVQYSDGVRAMSACRQTDGASSAVCERIIGSKGYAYLDGAGGFIKGAKEYTYDGPNPNPYVVEHTDLIASIRAGKPLNEGKRVAESTLVAIMGRMSAYTGRDLKWSWAMNSSKLDLRPAKYEMGPLPVAPVAIPGKSELV